MFKLLYINIYCINLIGVPIFQVSTYPKPEDLFNEYRSQLSQSRQNR